MLALTTQETFGKPINDVQKDNSARTKLEHSLSLLDKDEFHTYFQQEYDAYWGVIKFEDSLSDYTTEARPFLYINSDVNLYCLRRFLTEEWKMHQPNVLIPILSSITRHKPYKSLKMIEATKNGIKNAANASEIWFLTNGLNAGVPQMIGSAFRDENMMRRADDAWAIQMGRPPKKRKPLTLIGVVCDDEIKDVLIFKSTKERSNLELKILPRKSEQLSLNGDHTHFIIIREPQSDSDEASQNKQTNADIALKSVEKLTDSAGNATNQFLSRFESFLHNESPEEPAAISESSSAKDPKSTPWGTEGIPMVCIFVRGTPGTIELLHEKIEQEVPVLIFKGSGSAADLISFAFEEVNNKSETESEDSYLKVELTRRILDEYPALKQNNVKRNEIRDRIISLIKKADQGKRKFVTFIDTTGTTSSLQDLHKYILTALLQSQQAAGGKAAIQTKRNLCLTMDWNLPDLALSEIFQRDDDMKYNIPTELFDKALLGKKLEPFVDLFLDKDFALHRYLKSDKLVELFNKAKDREFLTTTSLEGILGLTGDEEEMPENFVEHGLNIIVKRLTGISHFFSKHEMDCNAMGIYFGDKSDKGVQKQRMRAEKKALRHLIIYAVLMNRHQLAKILWKRSQEPIPLALICYMMYKNLAPYCHESYQKLLTQKQAKEFSDCAVGVLDKAFNEDNIRTFEMLDEKHPDWNQMATVELAYNADNKEFMAHAACQKWVTRQFYGEITPRELSWGLFKCPTYLKIVFCAVFIFPMWFWINFSPIGQAPPAPKKNTEPEHGGDKDKDGERKSSLTKGSPATPQRNSFYQRIKRGLGFGDSKSSNTAAAKTSSEEEPMGFFEEVQVLWSAPITKFYTNFVAYLVYLTLFTLAVMWPTCGNLLLDCLVWFWTASIAFENTRVAYEKYCSQSSLPLQRAVLEVIVQTIFLALYLSVRIIGLWNFGTCHVLPAKAILACGLIYYYYRILFIFLPISPKLGPMMIRLRCMIMDDFFTFLQLFLIFMISYGVAITAVVYPHYPLSLELFTKAFIFRGLMALFSGDTTDLKKQNLSCSINATTDIDKEYSCLRLSHGLSFDYDNPQAYRRYGIQSPTCNQTSWVAWFLLIQYFFLAKRFLTSLLTAMFGLTGARVQSQSQQIWMYNRYEIVMEYAKRPRLPPPFVVISYISMLLESCGRQCILKLKQYSDKKNSALARARTRSETTRNNNLLSSDDDDDDIERVADVSVEVIRDRSLLGRLLACQPCQKVTKTHEDMIAEQKINWEDSEANLYWKYKAKEFYAKTQEGDKVQDKLDGLTTGVAIMQKESAIQAKSLRQINDRVVVLEKLMIDSHLLLEKIRATVQQEDKLLPEYQRFIHILSRQSPYIYTNETRYPVTERYIPWRVPFDLYDPTILTLPKDHHCFQDSERPFVEEDLLKNLSRDYQEPPNDANTTDATTDPTAPLDSFGTIDIPSSPVMQVISTLISEYRWNKLVEVELADGRKMILDRTTWITGSGGETTPVYKVDSQLNIPMNPMGRTGLRGRGALVRWGPNKSIMALITRWKSHRGQFTMLEGQQVLEALVFKDRNTNDWKLPGGKILGIESAYGAVCRSFHKLAFNDLDSEHSQALQENDMIEHFKSFARPSTGAFGQDGFEARMIYRGYIDDLRNTDNAWVEAEVWNFHYGATVSFPELRADGMALWKEVTQHSRGFLIQNSILREIARNHDAFFE